MREALRLHEALDVDRARARRRARGRCGRDRRASRARRGPSPTRAGARRRPRPGAVVPAIGLRLARRPSSLDERLGRGADQGDLAELEQEEVRRGVDAAERAVEVERARRGRPLGALREDDLEGVAGADVLLRAPRPSARTRSGRGSARGRPRPCPSPRGSSGVGASSVARAGRRRRTRTSREAARVVEAHERVGDDEPALRQVGPVGGERHRRLERRDVVVAEVADDGRRSVCRLRT